MIGMINEPVDFPIEFYATPGLQSAGSLRFRQSVPTRSLEMRRASLFRQYSNKSINEKRQWEELLLRFIIPKLADVSEADDEHGQSQRLASINIILPDDCQLIMDQQQPEENSTKQYSVSTFSLVSQNRVASSENANIMPPVMKQQSLRSKSADYIPQPQQPMLISTPTTIDNVKK